MKNALILLVLSLLYLQPITGQENNVELAKVYTDMGNYKKAIATYKNSYNELNEYQLFELAKLYTITDNNSKAIETYRFLITQYPDFQKGYLPLAHTLRKNGRYAQAMKYYEVYGNFDPNVSQHYIESMRWAERQRKEAAIVASRKNLSINTEFFDGFPVNYNENVVFASNRDDIQRTVDKGNKKTTQLFVTHHTGENSFTFPSFLLKDLQQWESMATIATSPVSEEIIFTKISQASIIQEFRSSDRGMKLYTADLIEGELESLKPLPFNSINYNTAGACYSDDGNTIYYMSNKAGGFGGYDIYSSSRNGDSWSKPHNLGEKINSSGDEILPQLIDGNLVYASNWLTGFGGYDIFVSTFNLPSMEWNKPSNLGLGLNTQRDEFALVEMNNQYYLTAMTDDKSADLYAVNNIRELESQPHLVKTATKNEHKDMSKEFNQAFANEETARMQKGKKVNESKNAMPIMTELENSLSTSEIHTIQKNSLSKKRKIYSVQVAVVDKDNNEKLIQYGEALSDIDAVYKIYFPEVIKVRVGSYDTESRAQRTLNLIQSRGYKDAFIVVEQVIYSSNSQNQYENDVSVNKAHSSAETEGGSGYIEDRKDHTIRDINTVPIGDGNFKVRLATYSQPKWFSADKVRSLGNIQRIDREEWTIYLIGDYNSVRDAEIIQKEVKKRGFKQAQVVEIVNGKLHRLE